MYECEQCRNDLDLDVEPWQRGDLWYRCQHCGYEGKINLDDGPDTTEENEGIR